VEAFDTNVLVRLIVRDDETQCRQAERTFRSAVEAGGAWIASVVLVEVSWVLRVAYKFDRGTITAALRRLTATEGVHIEDAATTELALAAYEGGSADFSDFFILESARRGGALPLHTFDERLSRADGAKLVE
jgi:predicted nucleic-acid-binding protein